MQKTNSSQLKSQSDFQHDEICSRFFSLVCFLYLGTLGTFRLQLSLSNHRHKPDRSLFLQKGKPDHLPYQPGTEKGHQLMGDTVKLPNGRHAALCKTRSESVQGLYPRYRQQRTHCSATRPLPPSSHSFHTPLTKIRVNPPQHPCKEPQ